jgi:hypothetical protein
VLKDGNYSESGLSGLLAILLGFCLAMLLLSLNYLGAKTNFEDAAAFGAETSIVMASVDGYRIHCSDSRDAGECIAGAKARRVERSVLWLGNSQVHAVNQLGAGETNAAPILFDRLRGVGLDLVTFSQPNANLQEHLVLFEYLQQQLPLRMLILPAVFDDTREEGLRREVARLVGDVPTRAALSATDIGGKIVHASEKLSPDTDGDTAGIAHTLQDAVERGLNIWMETHSALWTARPEIRGQLMLRLYLWRNTILGITPSSKRKLIRGRYKDNMSALAAILGAAKSRDISVLVYIVPLRTDVDIPYVAGEYEAFKAEVNALANRYGATFANLETLVPTEFWGSKAATSSGGGKELDFMHFQAGGHRLLAARLAELTSDAWEKREASR